MPYNCMMFVKSATEEFRAARKAKSLLGTEDNGWDCAAALDFLSTAHALRITGAVLRVDAGTTAAVGTRVTKAACIIALQHGEECFVPQELTVRRDVQSGLLLDRVVQCRFDPHQGRPVICVPMLPSPLLHLLPAL